MKKDSPDSIRSVDVLGSAAHSAQTSSSDLSEYLLEGRETETETETVQLYTFGEEHAEDALFEVLWDINVDVIRMILCFVGIGRFHECCEVLSRGDATFWRQQLLAPLKALPERDAEEDSDAIKYPECNDVSHSCCYWTGRCKVESKYFSSRERSMIGIWLCCREFSLVNWRRGISQLPCLYIVVEVVALPIMSYYCVTCDASCAIGESADWSLLLQFCVQGLFSFSFFFMMILNCLEECTWCTFLNKCTRCLFNSIIWLFFCLNVLQVSVAASVLPMYGEDIFFVTETGMCGALSLVALSSGVVMTCVLFPFLAADVAFYTKKKRVVDLVLELESSVYDPEKTRIMVSVKRRAK